MPSKGVSQKHWFIIALATSLVVAFWAWDAPQGQMPLNFHSMLWRSLPLAGIWVLTLVISAFRFRKRALWLLAGAPLALYWPVWLLLNGIPACYWHGSCV